MRCSNPCERRAVEKRHAEPNELMRPRRLRRMYTLGLKLSRRYQSLMHYDLALLRHESAVRRPAH